MFIQPFPALGGLNETGVSVANMYPFLRKWLNFVPTRISNHIHCNVYDEIIYPCQDFNGETSVKIAEKYPAYYLAWGRWII